MSKLSPASNELLRDLAGAIDALDRFEANAIDAARAGEPIGPHMALIDAHANAIAGLARLLVQSTGHAAERIKRNDILTRLQ